MIENLIRETSLRLLNLLGEQSEELKTFFSDIDNMEIVEEAIEVLTDEALRNFDEYLSSLEDQEDSDE